MQDWSCDSYSDFDYGRVSCGWFYGYDGRHTFLSPKGKKLEILKDSHIGAFSVIMLAVYGLVFGSAFSTIQREALLKIVCCGFFLSRCLCGISALSFPLAKKDGMLYTFAGSSHKRAVKYSLYLQSAVCVGLMCFWSAPEGLVVAAASVLALVYYFYRSRKEFGGVTGDTAGYFVLLCEACIVVAAAFMDVFMGRA